MRKHIDRTEFDIKDNFDVLFDAVREIEWENWAPRDAAFIVGGVTKGVEGLWLQGTKMLTRFDVVSDANGEISGTFAAADSNGGAFNGLTLVGDMPKIGTTVIIR